MIAYPKTTLAVLCVLAGLWLSPLLMAAPSNAVLQPTEVITIARALLEEAGCDFGVSDEEATREARNLSYPNLQCTLDMFDSSRKIGVILKQDAVPINGNVRRQVSTQEPELTSDEALELELMKLRGELFVLVIDHDSYSYINQQNGFARKLNATGVAETQECDLTIEMLRGRLRRQVKEFITYLRERDLLDPAGAEAETTAAKKKELDEFEEEVSAALRNSRRSETRQDGTETVEKVEAVQRIRKR